MRVVGGKPWSDSEIQYLIDHHATMSTADIAKRLGRTPNAVGGMWAKLGIKEDQTVHRRAWTDEECKFLMENYGTMTQKKLAEILGRSFASTGHKLAELRLSYGLAKRQKGEYVPRPRTTRAVKPGPAQEAPPQYKYDVRPGEIVVAEYIPAAKRRSETCAGGGSGRHEAMKTVKARCTVLAVYKNIFIVKPEGTNEEVSLRRSDWVSGKIKRYRSET